MKRFKKVKRVADAGVDVSLSVETDVKSLCETQKRKDQSVPSLRQ